MNEIKFNIPYKNTISLAGSHISGDGPSTKLVTDELCKLLNINHLLLTTSCTSALEMSAILLNIKDGDEVIAPSFTFVSTVNAFVLRGAKIVFVDIKPDTMNIDEDFLESAITTKTKAIVVVHYAGVACNMDKIMQIANNHNLFVVEDAAQAVMAKFKDRYLGTIGDLATFSFHETKNYTMGEGGALAINNSSFSKRAEIIREKGTNRSSFLRGQVDKYTWIDLGSSYLPSDLLAAYLLPQIEQAEKILTNRLISWNLYYNNLEALTEFIELPFIPDYSSNNAHMFYIKVRDIDVRTKLIEFLKKDGIQAVFHYVPLHSSPAGIQFGRFHGEDNYTTKESERLLRLPIYYNIEKFDVMRVCNSIKRFFNETTNS